jgi:hypothetical protein
MLVLGGCELLTSEVPLCGLGTERGGLSIHGWKERFIPEGRQLTLRLDGQPETGRVQGSMFRVRGFSNAGSGLSIIYIANLQLLEEIFHL